MPKNNQSKSVKKTNKLIKIHIRSYLNGTRSRDMFEIRSHCKKLFKHIKPNNNNYPITQLVRPAADIISTTTS